jgi:hypothetical protein
MFGKLKKRMMGRKESASTGSTPVPPQQYHDESDARPGTAEATTQPTSGAALREGNPAVDMGKGAALAEQEKRVAELQDMLANMEKSKMFLKDEHRKLQRIEDALQVTETELLEYKDGADVTEKSRFISNVQRLRDERMLCHNRQDMHNGFINTLKDQIAAAELKNNVEGYVQPPSQRSTRTRCSTSPMPQRRRFRPSIREIPPSTWCWTRSISAWKK